MKLRLLFMLLVLAAARGFGLPAEVIIIRHAEEPSTPNAIHLSPRGQQRAKALVSFFTQNPTVTSNGLPVAMFAPHPIKGSSLRSRETLIPAARQLRLSVREPVVAEGYQTLAKQILNNPAFDGKTVVLAWVHTYLPKIASAFGVKNAPNNWNASAYDRAYIITFPNGKPKLQDIPQRLLPGDAKK